MIIYPSDVKHVTAGSTKLKIAWKYQKDHGGGAEEATIGGIHTLASKREGSCD